MRDRIARTVVDGGGFATYFTDAELAGLSSEDRAWMVEGLTAHISELSRFRRRLRDAGQPADAVRRCAVCGEPVHGRVDKRFCSAKCRVVAHRASHR